MKAAATAAELGWRKSQKTAKDEVPPPTPKPKPPKGVSVE